MKIMYMITSEEKKSDKGKRRALTCNSSVIFSQKQRKDKKWKPQNLLHYGIIWQIKIWKNREIWIN